MKTALYDSMLRKIILTLISAILCGTATILQATPTISLAQNAVSVSQRAGSVIIPVQVSGKFDMLYGNTKFPEFYYTTQAGTTSSGSGYDGDSGWKTFSTENSTINISIPINYTGATTDVFFTVVITDTYYANLGATTACTVTILAESPVIPIRFSFGQGSYAVSQKAGAIQIPVTYTGAPQSPNVSVEYKTQPGTANGDDDYDGTSWSTLEFTPGSNTALVTIPIYNTGATVDKFFNVLLVDSSEGEIGTPAAATVTILGKAPSPAINILTTKGPLNRWFNIHGAVSNVRLSDIKKVTLAINGQKMHPKGKKNWVARVKAGSSGTYTMVARAYLKNGRTLKTKKYLYIY